MGGPKKGPGGDEEPEVVEDDIHVDGLKLSRLSQVMGALSRNKTKQPVQEQESVQGRGDIGDADVDEVVEQEFGDIPDGTKAGDIELKETLEGGRRAVEAAIHVLVPGAAPIVPGPEEIKGATKEEGELAQPGDRISVSTTGIKAREE